MSDEKRKKHFENINKALSELYLLEKRLIQVMGEQHSKEALTHTAEIRKLVDKFGRWA